MNARYRWIRVLATVLCVGLLALVGFANVTVAQGPGSK